MPSHGRAESRLLRWASRDVLGLRVDVREGGRGETVVLLHGLGVSGAYFEPLANELATTRRVVVPDLPGWRKSQRPRRTLTLDEAADVLDGILRDEGPGPAVVANSLGCQIVLRSAVRRAAPIGRLVLIGPTVDPRYRSWARQTLRLLLDAGREPARLLPLLVADYARMGPARVLATAGAALADRPEQRLPQIHERVLVIRGERDAVTTEAWARRCADLAPSGAFVGVAGAAHAVHFSHAAFVARIIEAFLEESGDRGP